MDILFAIINLLFPGTITVLMILCIEKKIKPEVSIRDLFMISIIAYGPSTFINILVTRGILCIAALLCGWNSEVDTFKYTVITLIVAVILGIVYKLIKGKYKIEITEKK